MAKRKIAGARAIVTGASSGIGRELARQLAAQKAQLVITARRRERLEELAGQIRQAGGQVDLLAGDITDREHRRQLLELARQQLGGLDILVNNAAVTAIGPFVHSGPERLRKIMEVNFFAPVETIRQALPMLRDGNRPIVVNVCSVLAHRAVPKKVEYCASKFALHGFSDGLRAELAPLGIDVLIVSPSTTDTEIFERAEGDPRHLPWLSLGAARPEWVARQAIKAIRRGRHEVILTTGGKLLVWFDRLCPPLINRLVARFG